MAIRNNIAPALMPVHPGEILSEELKERGMSQKSFALQIGMSPSYLSELIRGKISVTLAIADKLERGLGINSQFWTNLQADYNTKVNVLSEKYPATLEVAVENRSFLADVRKAISKIRGVRRVAVL